MFWECSWFARSSVTSVKSLGLWSFWSSQVNHFLGVKMLTKHGFSDSPRRVSEDFTPIDYFPIQVRHCDSTVQQELFIYISTWETICTLHYSKCWRGKEVYTQMKEWHVGRGKSMLLKCNDSLSPPHDRDRHLHNNFSHIIDYNHHGPVIPSAVQLWYLFHIGIISSEWIGSLAGWSVQVQEHTQPDLSPVTSEWHCTLEYKWGYLQERNQSGK